MNKQETSEESYIRTLLEEGGISAPTQHFTSNVMNKIEAQADSSAFRYTPVISKNVWRTFAVLGVAIALYMVLATPSDSQPLQIYGYSIDFDFSIFTRMMDGVALSFELSPILKTSMLALFVLAAFQLIFFELKGKALFK
jgi:hypothetical protein